MKQGHTERTKDARYQLETKVILERDNGETILAASANISSAGMCVHVEHPCRLSLDEEVTVEVELPDSPGQPFSAWGVARVVRIDGCCRFGIELRRGTLDFENRDGSGI